MKGMILAAGFGERLWPLTADRTKPALPVLGKPLVGFVAEYLGKFGISEIVVNLHHQPDSVRSALGDGSAFAVHLEYVFESVILGTSGAVDNARHLLEGGPFVVINGKLITDIDLNAALATHRKMDALATMVLLPNTRRERFSMVETREGLVTGFGAMPKAAAQPNEATPLLFTGIQIFESRIFDYIPRGRFSHSVVEVYPQAIARGERIAAHVADGMWYELSTLQRYLDISLALMRLQDRDVHYGRNSQVDPGSQIHDAVLWDDVIVEAGANVQRAILGDRVRIPAGAHIENAVVVPAVLVAGVTPPDRALKGDIQGDNFVVPLSQ